MSYRSLPWAIVLIIGAIPRPGLSNPSHKDPHASMPVFGGEASQKLLGLGTQRYDAARQDLDRLTELVNSGKPQAIPPRDIQQSNTAIMQLERAAEQLQYLREPAGYDFMLRAKAERHRHWVANEAFKATPPGQKFIQQCRQRVAQTATIRQKKLQELQQLASQNKWEQAETEWYDFYDKLQTLTVVLTSEENRPVYSPFGEVSAAIQQKMSEARRAAGLKLLQAQRVQETPDLAGLLQQLGAAAQSLAATGQVEVGGQVLPGPAAVTHFGNLWTQVHVQALHCRALDWALADSQGMPYPGPMDDSSGSARAEPVVASYRDFTTQMTAGLARLVEADAARVGESEVSSLYHEYVKALAPLVAQGDREMFLAAFEPALEKLAARSPPLAENVAGYRRATREVLRWRRRVADAMARAKMGDALRAPQRLLPGFISAEPYLGLFPQENSNAQPPLLLAGAPAVLEGAVPRLMDQPAIASNVVSLAAGKAAIGQYADRVYVSTRVPPAYAEPLHALKTDLFATTAPPLTLAAAVAIDTAERGDILAVGGKISGVYLEGWITRFASLPLAAAPLVPLGRMPVERVPGNPISNVVVRFDLNPLWAQHDQFFVELPAAEIARRPE